MPKKLILNFKNWFNASIEHPIAATLDAILDGMYSSISGIRYISDCARHYYLPPIQLDSDELLESNAILTAILVTYSVLSKRYIQPEASKRIVLFLNWIIISWPYFRDLMSGLKKGRQAVVNIGLLIQPTMQSYIYTIINPIGIAIGILLALYLVWLRDMNTKRRKEIAENVILANQIEQNLEINFSTLSKKPSYLQCARNYLAAITDGLLDGFYLYGCVFLLAGIGVSGLTSGAPLVAAIVIISVITFFACIAKLSEEYNEQLKLKCSILKIEISFLNKRIKSLKNEMKSFNLDTLQEENYLADQLALKEYFYNNYIRPFNPREYCFGIQVMFYLQRAIISGAKNAKAGFDSVKFYIDQVTVKCLLTLISIPCGILYAIYLCGKAVDQQITACKPHFFLKKTPCKQSLFSVVSSIFDFSYFRNLIIYNEINSEHKSGKFLQLDFSK